MSRLSHTDPRIKGLIRQIAEYQTKIIQLEVEYKELSRRTREIVNELEYLDQETTQLVKELATLVIHKKEVNEE